jgi:hypothetical protein
LAIREAKPGFGQTLANGAPDAGLADPGLSGEEHVTALGTGIDDFVDERLAR